MTDLRRDSAETSPNRLTAQIVWIENGISLLVSHSNAILQVSPVPTNVLMRFLSEQGGKDENQSGIFHVILSYVFHWIHCFRGCC